MAQFEASDALIEGLAHLYAGLIKADSVISDEEATERARKKIMYYRSKNIYFLDGNEHEKIHPALTHLLTDSEYEAWESAQHEEKALALLKNEGAQINNILPIRETLKALAKMDTLTLAETKYIKRVITVI